MIAMKRIGKDFQQFDSDTTAMVLLEGQDKLGDEAHRYYDQIVAKLGADTKHVEHVDNFWADPLTAAGSESPDAKAAYVQLNLRGNQGDTTANESVAAVYNIVASVPAPPGIKAYVTGPGPLNADRRAYGDRSLAKITIITVVVIAAMLLFAYRSILTTIFMLLTVGIELASARGAVAILGYYNIIGLSTFAVNLLVSLARGLDGLHHLPGRPVSGGPLARARPNRRLLHDVYGHRARDPWFGLDRGGRHVLHDVHPAAVLHLPGRAVCGRSVGGGRGVLDAGTQ
jgi:uncharacterized membrane protein YdfJ with MMPL/SSD domain